MNQADLPNTGAAWRVPPEVLAAEYAQYSRNQKAVGLAPAKDVTQALGLAISGGGIRSAIFSLGVLQAMARSDVLRHCGYISTVSGGSYIGAFYGSLFVPPNLRTSTEPKLNAPPRISPSKRKPRNG